VQERCQIERPGLLAHEGTQVRCFFPLVAEEVA
jgi:dipeptide transport system ATP-binding protein